MNAFINNLIMLQNPTVRVILGGITLIGLSYLTYRFWKSHKRPKSPKRKVSQESHEEQRLRTVHSNYSEFYFDKEEQLRKVVGLVSEKGPNVEQIYLLSPIILVDEYLKYTQEIRKRRRLIRKINEDQYICLVRNYEFEVKELLRRGRQQLLQEFGRSADDLERMESAFEMFDDLQGLRKKAHLQLQQRAFPPSKARRIPAAKLRRIIEEEINFINNRMHERVKLKLQADQMGITQQEIYRILTTLIDDVIYEKYGYEREDIQNQLNEMPILDKELKRSRKNLFAEIGNFNLDSMESPDESEQPEQENKQSISDRTQILQDSVSGE